MLTPLGKALRKLRIERGWLLKDMAEGVGVTSSFLSGIETGRKKVPENFVDRIISWANVNAAEATELKEFESISRQEFTIPVSPNFSTSDLQTAALLHRFGDLPADERDQIRRILVKRFS